MPMQMFDDSPASEIKIFLAESFGIPPTTVGIYVGLGYDNTHTTTHATITTSVFVPHIHAIFCHIRSIWCGVDSPAKSYPSKFKSTRTEKAGLEGNLSQDSGGPPGVREKTCFK